MTDTDLTEMRLVALEAFVEQLLGRLDKNERSLVIARVEQIVQMRYNEIEPA